MPPACSSSPTSAQSKQLRQSRLLEHVMERERVEVQELSELLGVSQVTVRKDLDELSGRGLLVREHGYAVAGSGDDMRTRLAYHHAAKRRIAQEVARWVDDGETVLIESGSTCVLLAEELCSSPRGVTIVTNSAFLAAYVRRSPYADVILLGGIFQPESQVLVGELTAQCAANFHIDKMFVGVDGYASGVGFTGRDAMRAETVRALSAQARRVVVLTESAKFDRPGALRLLPAGAVRKVFTDDGISPETVAHLNAEGVDVRVVPSAHPR
ncbi:DeoR/GlpR family DNA-binding transcription regulator [Austwickia chelonae]|uniref:DeoR/GlpR family DNA-binding transcription regulator n=1 Tax=Austwickia chelonae TaxID=100225 RepID=UPI000E23031C|nr:DeoR/GlpR family DNA-binding transcription regulator [Austwickia chelonae]